MNNFEQDVFESGLIKCIPELLEQAYEKAESRPLLENDNLLNNILRSRTTRNPIKCCRNRKRDIGITDDL